MGSQLLKIAADFGPMQSNFAPMKRIAKGAISGIREKLRSQQGGAIVEFVALALPLFIPIFIYLSHYASISDQESVLRTLAREISRAVVTSESDGIAERVAEEVFYKGGSALGLGEAISNGTVKFTIHCKERPCISPNNEIEISIFSSSINRTISAVEYVSPWA
jgi:hypothetical protein